MSRLKSYFLLTLVILCGKENWDRIILTLFLSELLIWPAKLHANWNTIKNIFKRILISIFLLFLLGCKEIFMKSWVFVDASTVYVSCQVVGHKTFHLFFCNHAFSCIYCLHCLLIQFTNTNHYFKQVYFYCVYPNYSNAETWHCIIFMLL